MQVTIQQVQLFVLFVLTVKTLPAFAPCSTFETGDDILAEAAEHALIKEVIDNHTAVLIDRSLFADIALRCLVQQLKETGRRCWPPRTAESQPLANPHLVHFFGL